MENLSAAIPTAIPAKKLSKEEFKDSLSSWFEEKGIVAELKSHLRYKMMNILKNTPIGRDLVKKSLQKSNLSKQAINLIVAEFLMRNLYHYSLSVFNTEAGITDIFPFSDDGSESSVIKFDPENIRNIMELIGVPRSHVFCNDILDLYYSNQEDSILSCLVSLLHKVTNKEYEDNQESYKYADLDNENKFIEQIGYVLMEARIPSNNLNKVIQSIKLYFDIEVKELTMKHEQFVHILKTENIIKDEKLKEIQQSKNLVERKMIKLAREYKALKCHVEDMVRNQMAKLDESIPEKIANNVEEKIQKIDEKLETNSECRLSHCGRVCEDNLEVTEKLKQENRELRKANEKQSQEILSLSSNYNNLWKDFMAYKDRIKLLNVRMNQGDQPSIRMPGRDEMLVHDNELSSGDSSESLTEKLLRDTRMRLKTLEEESRAIEENYKYFHRNSQINL